MNSTRVLALAYLALAVLLAWPALNGQFLSDDLAIMHWLLGWDASGEFWSSIVAKFKAGLDVPSHYYRPLALLTYGLDQRLHGWSPLGWHLTGFAIHVINAALVGGVMRALGGDALRAVTAAALFLLFPLAPEVSIWFSGRYDALALTGMLIAVYAHLRADGFDRWRALSVFGFILGLTAKEAAMPTPGLLVLASLLRGPEAEALVARVLRTIRETAPVVVVFFLYLGFRQMLFGHPLQVYPGSDPSAALTLADALQRLFALFVIPRAVFADAAVVGTLALLAIGIAWIAAAVVTRRERVWRNAWLLPTSWALLSLLSLVPHLSGVLAHGEGGRFYYATAAWLALALAPAIALLRTTLQPALSIALVGAFALAQQHALSQWAHAGAAMHALLPQLANTATTLGDDDFALILVPDHLGPVPFARNAQAGLVLPPQQAQPLLPKLVPILPQGIHTWPKRIADGDVAKIKQRDVAPRLDAVFCFDARSRRIVRAGQMPDWRNAAAFAAQFRDFAGMACPDAR